MTIYKARTLADSYKLRSKAKNINELNGRGEYRDLTDFVISNILLQFKIKPTSTIVDVGCGDCTLFKQLLKKFKGGYSGKLIGILPNLEEILRVERSIIDNHEIKSSVIALQHGTVDNINLPDGHCDLLVVNSVIHGAAENLKDARTALIELIRIIKPGGQLYIGELPSVDEFADRNYNKDSIISWLKWIYIQRGFPEFWVNFLRVIKCMVSKEPFIIEPKKKFYMLPENFIEMMKNFGVQVIRYYPHQELNQNKVPIDSVSRWNYIFVKKVLNSN